MEHVEDVQKHRTKDGNTSRKSKDFTSQSPEDECEFLIILVQVSVVQDILEK